MDENTKVATGYIIEEVVDTQSNTKEFTSTEDLELKSEDIYRLFSKRGYDYR